jgi:hypothetical protein
VFPRQRQRHSSLLLPHTTVRSVAPDDTCDDSAAALLPQRPRSSFSSRFRRFSTAVTPLSVTAGLSVDGTPVVPHHSSSSTSSGTRTGDATRSNSSSSTAAANSSTNDVEEACSPIAVEGSAAVVAARRSSSGTAVAGSGNRIASFVQVQPAFGRECDAV